MAGLHIKTGGQFATDEFADLLVKLADAYPQMSARLSDAQIVLYAKSLGDVPLPLLKQAAARAVRECRFFPSVSDLRGFIVPTGDDAALLAWSNLVKASEVVGSYSSIEIEDGCAAQALQDTFGSWPEFCVFEDGPGLALKRQEFLAAYRQARRENVPQRRLGGLLEASGRYPSQPVNSAIWCARLTKRGEIISERDKPRLTGGESARKAGALGPRQETTEA